MRCDTPPIVTDDSLLPFDLRSVQRKEVSAAFDCGLISSGEDRGRWGAFGSRLSGVVGYRSNSADDAP